MDCACRFFTLVSHVRGRISKYTRGPDHPSMGDGASLFLFVLVCITAWHPRVSKAEGGGMMLSGHSQKDVTDERGREPDKGAILLG